MYHCSYNNNTAWWSLRYCDLMSSPQKDLCFILSKKIKSRFHINYSHLLKIFISDWPLIHKYEHFIWACPVHNIYIIWFWSDEIHVHRCTLLWNYEETRTLYSFVVPKLHVNGATHKIGSIRTKHRVFSRWNSDQ